MSKSANPNLGIVRRKAGELGATIIDIREGSNHTIVVFLTKSNRKVQMTISRHKVDNYIMQGWVRQVLQRRPADILEDALLNAANDNDPRATGSA